jgi:DNA-binding transcriptional ArsR family regulator
MAWFARYWAEITSQKAPAFELRAPFTDPKAPVFRHEASRTSLFSSTFALQTRMFHGILSPVMSDASAAKSSRSKLDAAFSNPMRWQMMRIMADGKTLTANEASRVLRRDIDTVMKHLRLLRSKGLIETVPGQQDKRYLFYYIPARWLPQPGVLDYGFCTIRFESEIERIDISK